MFPGWTWHSYLAAALTVFICVWALYTIWAALGDGD